jgi:hypothetical protein
MPKALTNHTAKTLFRKFERIFLEKKLRGLHTNFHIHVTLGNLYITTIGPPILLQKIGGWKLETRPRSFISENT